jgi:signal transduction histidine kinase
VGRLFWKFFFVLLLAQTLSVFGVGFLFALHNREFEQSSRMSHAVFPPYPRREGPGFGPGSRDAQSGPEEWAERREHWRERRHGPAGEEAREEKVYDPEDGPPPRGLIPTIPLLSGLAASLIFAALLAWYFAKPIRGLSRAFDAVAQGDLSVRLSAEMGGRRDELADLGRDFDSMAQRVQDLMDGQRRLFHDVSHELRSPLTRMQVAIGLARQQPERGEQALSRVERESVRMDQLVSELLTLARLESGMSAYEQEEIALGEFVDNIVEDSRVEAEAKHCKLSLDETGAEGVLVAGSPELLRRCVENVLRNAIRHSPEDGEVRVTLRTAGAKRVEISILDQGDGVPEMALAKIFQPFFRGTEADGAKGYGLGLAIAQRVVAMHDGSILARNADKGGFNVVIGLPRLGQRL